MKEKDKYLKIVEWCEKDNCYIGSVPGWLGRVCHGKNEFEVYSKLSEIVIEWVDIYKKEGMKLPKPTNKEYSGKFVLRTGSELHKILSLQALNNGESLNHFVIKKLKTII